MTTPQHTFTIGRNRTCDIPLADDSISGHHAELTFLSGGRLLMTDCNSTNGTFLLQGAGREQRLRQELISPMDSIRFGNVTLGVKALLEALRLKFPQFEEALSRPASPAATPWIRGRRLIRCVCGCIKAVDQACAECGR